MRRLALMGALLAASAAHASKCESNGLLVFPAPGSVIPLNAKFILEGVGSEVARVNKLVGGDDLVLKAGDDVVTVSVSKGWSSLMKRTAVVLKPSAELKPNKTYSLVIERLLPGYKVLNTNASETLTWHTGAGSDTTPPKYQVKPAVAEGYWHKDSDGITRYLKLRTTLVEEGPAYFLVTIQRSRGSPVKQTYPLPINGGEALIGQDSCSGTFTFDDGRSYRIWVETYDSAGNKAPDKLAVIEAQAPLQQN